jgi:hypothetical protein
MIVRAIPVRSSSVMVLASALPLSIRMISLP